MQTRFPRFQPHQPQQRQPVFTGGQQQASAEENARALESFNHILRAIDAGEAKIRHVNQQSIIHAGGERWIFHHSDLPRGERYGAHSLGERYQIRRGPNANVDDPKNERRPHREERYFLSYSAVDPFTMTYWDEPYNLRDDVTARGNTYGPEVRDAAVRVVESLDSIKHEFKW